MDTSFSRSTYAPRQTFFTRPIIRQTGKAFFSVPRRLLAVLAILFVALSWSTTYSITKETTQGVSPVAFLALRFGLATIVLLFVLFVWRHQWRFPSWQEWKWGLISGAIFSAVQIFQVSALKIIDSGRAGFLISMYSMVTPVLAWLLLKHRLDRRELTMLVVALTGIVLLTYAPGNNPLGDGLALLTAVGLGLLMISFSRIPHQADRGFVALIQVAFVTIVCATLTFITSGEGMASLRIFPRSALLGAAYLGIVATGMAVTFLAWGQRLIPPTYTALIMATEIPLAVLIGVIFRGETFTPIGILGCGLVLGGTWVSTVRQVKKARA
jgi:drug/metabolite transporter (DMT)-like permease